MLISWAASLSPILPRRGPYTDLGRAASVHSPAARPSLCPGPMVQGVSYVHYNHKPAGAVHKKRMMPAGVSLLRRRHWPYRGGAMRYSPNYAVKKFSEV